MTLEQIRQMPTIVDTGPNSLRLHESLLRSFMIVEKVKELLEKETPPIVILEIIDDLMNSKGIDLNVSDKLQKP